MYGASGGGSYGQGGATYGQGGMNFQASPTRAPQAAHTNPSATGQSF